MNPNLPPARDSLLFTPGPLTTSLAVRQRMLRDVGSWDREFATLVADIRGRMLNLASLSAEEDWTVVLLQGSGTYGVEAVMQTCVPPKGKVAVLSNGAYGERIAQILSYAKIDHVVLRESEDTQASAVALEELLANDDAITHVAVVHCETTTGILNPIEQLGAVARKHHRVFIVDAMSSFGGIPIDFESCGIDYLVCSSNKCIEGVPGFSGVVCRKSKLLDCAGWARSLSLDLAAQCIALDTDGKFRFTPPTHTLLAFHQALIELETEGGIGKRNLRYCQNHAVLQNGMARLGFKPYLDPAVQSPIITAYHYPDDFEFNFRVFYQKLSERGFIIYPGKLTQVDTFRIGNIGRIFEADMQALLSAIREVLSEMGVMMRVATDIEHSIAEFH